jgi:serine/threonine protein kinase
MGNLIVSRVSVLGSGKVSPLLTVIGNPDAQRPRRTGDDLTSEHDNLSRHAQSTTTIGSGSTVNGKGRLQVKGAEEPMDENISIKTSGFVVEAKGGFHKRYHVQQVLGKGAFGEVKLVLDSVTQQKRALKCISKAGFENLSEASISREIDVLSHLNHPNIIKLYEFYQDPENVYLITELCTGGELFDRIIKMKHFAEAKAAIVMRQLLSAVAYCHARKIVHRYLR